MNPKQAQEGPDERAANHAMRVRRALHGQRGPQSSIGWGRRALFRCPLCGRPWLMDGPQFREDLAEAELHQVAAELGADLADLPSTPCAHCARAHARFRIERDEYVTADGRLVGYGFNIEGEEPPGAHVVIMVHQAAEFQRHLQRGLDVRAHVPVHATQERQLWAWLARLATPPAAQQYYRDPEPGDHNPPGHGAPGTASWRWGGALWFADCPPLGGGGIVHLALAIPPHEHVSTAGLVAICRAFAQGALDDPTFFASFA